MWDMTGMRQNKMNAKKAKEIIDHHDESEYNRLNLREAQGYLQCYEKVKGLVEALGKVTSSPKGESVITADYHKIHWANHSIAKDALAQWRKDK